MFNPRLERIKGNFGIRVLNRFSIGVEKLHGHGKTIGRILIRVVKAKDDLQFAIPIVPYPVLRSGADWKHGVLGRA